MINELPENEEELVDRFGVLLVQNFEGALAATESILKGSSVPVHQKFKVVLSKLPVDEQILMVAQSALEVFIHDLMASFDESHDFKIVGKLRNEKETDLRNLCPEGLHGNQLDWFEKYSKYKDVYEEILDRYPD